MCFGKNIHLPSRLNKKSITEKINMFPWKLKKLTITEIKNYEKLTHLYQICLIHVRIADEYTNRKAIPKKY